LEPSWTPLDVILFEGPKVPRVNGRQQFGSILAHFEVSF